MSSNFGREGAYKEDGSTRKKCKQEREEKKKQKMEEKTRKAEERAKKAEDKAKKKEEKANVAAAKATSKGSTTGTMKRKSETSAPSAKRAKISKEQFEVDVNTRCICFGTYEEDLLAGGGEDWLQCSCKSGSMKSV